MKSRTQTAAEIVGTVKEKHPLIPDAVSNRMKGLLDGRFVAGVLSKGELSVVAKELIGEIYAIPTGAEK